MEPSSKARAGVPAGRPRRPLGRRLLRAALLLLAAALVVAAGFGLWLRGRLVASLPRLDGEVRLTGIEAPVTVERDALGIPTIRGESRRDVARATGFVHAQDRFFQMDLLRRAAAGELAELVGPAVVGADRAARVFRLRQVARGILEEAAPEHRAQVEAYAEGVNAGVAGLGAPPFEYLALRVPPSPWRAEDTVLVLLAMCQTLHDDRGTGESALGLLHDVLPEEMVRFLAPEGTEWDAPLVGPAFEVPPVPGPEVFALRAAPPGGEAGPADAAAAGSNNWAVAGSRTAHGGAILAGDMHLPLGVPNIWYRASLAWTDNEGGEHRATGVTLPGLPVLVAGSNGRVAWAFTNTEGDWVDLVVLETDPEDPEVYRTPDGPRRIERHEERIRVKGGEDETVEVEWTIWGPVIDRDHRGRRRAVHWTAMVPGGTNLLHGQLEWARDVDEALAYAPRVGSPPQNLVVADSSGRIGWTILGRIPRRAGFDGRVPVSWADGTRRWDGWLDPSEYPKIVDPPEGRLWTANARTVDGVWLERLGRGGFPFGARARQIREDLRAAGRVDERAMLAIQLDDRAVFLARWRDLLLGLLTDDAVAAKPRRAALRDEVAAWGGRASIDSVGYRLVRAFRSRAAERVLGAVTAAVQRADGRFRFWQASQYEGPLWRLVTERPAHLLDPAQTSWEEWLLGAADAVLDELLAGGEPLRSKTWGARNTVRIQHPLSLAVPALGRWLDMPAEALPGDSYMPRVQGPTEGASQRMAVSPGREAEGYFHMPAGQSGHPLSPHYRDGHRAWVDGEPTPFLPGPPAHTLALTP
jgi:penicillin amidase